jgi:hypothetical protein
VYLDGDLPDAQKWGDVFRVTGYPTVVVLKPDKTEITRIAGNMDLNLYASVLDDALADVRPVKDLLAYAAKGEGPLSSVDCRRLAYHAFGLEDDGVFDRAQLEAAFGNASRACPAELAKERARFAFLAAAEAATRQKDALEKGGKADKALGGWIVRVNELLANKDLALTNADVVRGLPKEFYLAARQTLPQVAPTLRERVMAVGDAATVNPQFAPADQLAAQLIKIRVAKAYAPDGKVPTDVRSVALNTSTKMLAVKQDPYVRAGVVNSASNIYIALDELEKLRALMVQEAATSNTPWYYLGDLADTEEELGDKQAALGHMAEAYQKAKGPASRFQWGFNYCVWRRMTRRPSRRSAPRCLRNWMVRIACIAARCHASRVSTRRCASGTRRRRAPPCSRSSETASPRPARNRRETSQWRQVAAVSARPWRPRPD